MPEDLRRVRWLCRRGMKELDVMLAAFLADGYAALSMDEQACFGALLHWQDPELFALLSGQQEAPDDECARVVRKIRDSARLSG